VWVLRGITFSVASGESVGIVGLNGAGKSTLLKILSRITEPTTGQVEIRGRVGSLLEVGTGFHPELTGRENIFLNGAILGMSRAEVKRQFDEIVDFSGRRGRGVSEEVPGKDERRSAQRTHSAVCEPQHAGRGVAVHHRSPSRTRRAG
jgi:ABC-type multidrug transport system ATPase subunit